MSFFLHTCIVFTQHIYAVTFHVVWGDSVKSVVQVMTKRTQKAGQAGQKGGGKTNGSSSEVNGGDGQSVSHTVSENGDIIKATLDENGEVLDEEIVGNVSDLPGS